MHQENIAQVEKRVSKILSIGVSDSAHDLARKFLKEFSLWKPKSLGLVNDLVSGQLNIDGATELTTNDLDKQFESMRETLDALGELLRG